MTEREVLKKIKDLCMQHHATRIILYGSRAKGTNTPRSDFDIAVSGVPDLDVLREKIDDLPTLYTIDILDLDEPHSPELREDIKQDGISI